MAVKKSLIHMDISQSLPYGNYLTILSTKNALWQQIIKKPWIPEIGKFWLRFIHWVKYS